MSEDVHALILCGGKGTRSADPLLPKILQEIDSNHDLLEALLRTIVASKISHASFLVAFGSEQIIDRARSLIGQFPQLSINFIQDENSRGTTGAVVAAVQKLPHAKFAIFLGDLAVSGDFSRAINIWHNSRKSVGFVCHPNLHPLDSDRFVFDSNGTMEFRRKNSFPTNEESPTIALGGIAFFKKESLGNFDFEEDDIIAHLTSLNLGDIIAINSSLYFKDCGTSSRLESIRRDFETGAFQRRGSATRGAIFIDRDGTMIPDIGTGRASIDARDFEHETVVAIRSVNEAGIPLFLVSNQPGIAKGQITFADVFRTQANLQEHLMKHNALIDDFRFCPHHPEVGFAGEVEHLKILCNCRKPLPGMLTDLAEIHGIDLQSSFVLGDTVNDQGAAASSGATYIKAVHNSPNYSVRKALEHAVERVLQ